MRDLLFLCFFQFTMDTFDRYFTLEEATETLAALEPTIEALRASRERILELQPDLETGLDKAIGNGGSRATGELMELMNRVRVCWLRTSIRSCLIFPVNAMAAKCFCAGSMGRPQSNFGTTSTPALPAANRSNSRARLRSTIQRCPPKPILRW